METPPSTGKIISGDLPIRTVKPVIVESSHALDIQQSRDSTDTKVSETSTESLPKPEHTSGSTALKFEDEVASTIGQAMTVNTKKKRKYKRPKSQRGKDKPTGFEEYNADGPLTPREWDEERNIYDPSRSFLDRLDSALIRYQYKRRIESERRNIFHKYLQYGGITVGQNFGTGITPQELKQMGDEDAMRIRSQTAIAKEREGIEISWTKVARAFLGSFYVRFFNPDTEEDIKLATNTLQNFYTYLLFHEVFPEYNDDILEARKTCNLATEELCKSLHLVRQGPGGFNEACSSIFGGSFFVKTISEGWGSEDAGMSLEDARQIVKFAVAGASPHDQASCFQELANQNAFTAEKIKDIHGFEIVTLTAPEVDTRDFYHQFAPNLTPVGKIQARSFRDPAKPLPDMTPKERLEWDNGKGPNYDFELYLEENLLAFCYPGLKVLTSVWKLNCGVYYFDDIISTYPTFYTVLANDLMLEWKQPRAITDGDTKSPTHGLDKQVKDTVDKALKVTGHDSDQVEQPVNDKEDPKSED